MKYLVAIFALFLSLSASADVLVHVGSKHSSGKYNENNYGVGLVHQQNDSLSYAAGVYKNSLNDTSAYALVQYLPLQYKAFEAGFFGGVVSGYPKSPFAAGGLVRVHQGVVYHQFQLIPKVKGVTPATVGYSLGFKF